MRAALDGAGTTGAAPAPEAEAAPPAAEDSGRNRLEKCQLNETEK